MENGIGTASCKGTRWEGNIFGSQKPVKANNTSQNYGHSRLFERSLAGRDTFMPLKFKFKLYF